MEILGICISAISILVAVGIACWTSRSSAKDTAKKLAALDKSTKDQIAALRGMPFGVKSLEKRQNELIKKLFPESVGNVNATRLVVRAIELHIIDIDNLVADDE